MNLAMTCVVLCGRNVKERKVRTDGQGRRKAAHPSLALLVVLLVLFPPVKAMKSKYPDVCHFSGSTGCGQS